MRLKLMSIILLFLFSVPSGALTPAPPCQTSILAQLANVTCSRGDYTITYPDLAQIWQFSSSGPGAPVLTANDVVVVMDSNGPNAILIGSAEHWSTGWQVTAGQTMTGTISFTLTAPGGMTSLAQLGGAATEDGSTYLANNVDSVPPAVSSITCTVQSCPGNNTGLSFVHFTPGTYSASFTFTLDGGTNGTAALQMGSEHFR